MPYIALQLIGMGVVIKGDGPDRRGADHRRLHHSWHFIPIVPACARRADRLCQGHHDLYRGAGGRGDRAGKAWRLRRGVSAANDAFAAKGGATGLILKPSQMLAYATLALGSAFAAFMYPHTLTGIFASKSADTIRKNAILLPAYTLLLGLIALLGYMAYAANIKVSSPNDVVPLLFKALFPVLVRGLRIFGDRNRRAGACGGDEHRCREPVHPQYLEVLYRSRHQPCRRDGGCKNRLAGGEAGRASLHPFLPTQYALDLQLLGGLWILQTLPALVFGLFTRWFRAEGLLLGWAAGIGWGSWTAWSNGLKPLATIDLGGASYTFYVGLGRVACSTSPSRRS